MKTPTLFINRMDIALTHDMALLSLGEPSGPLGGKEIGSQEAVRLVLSHRTLRRVAAMLQKQVAELDARHAAAGREKSAAEERAITPDDEETAATRTLQ